MPYFLPKSSMCSGFRISVQTSYPRRLLLQENKCAAQSSGLPKLSALTWNSSIRYIGMKLDEERGTATEKTFRIIIVSHEQLPDSTKGHAIILKTP